MSGDPSADVAPGYGAALSRRYPVLAWIGRADDAVYGLERVLVTMSMLIMSGVVCISVLFQFLARQQAAFERVSNGGSATELWPTAALLLCVALLARGVWGQSPSCRGNLPAVLGLSALTVVAFSGLGLALVTLESNVVIGLTVAICGFWVALAELDRPRPIGGPAIDGVTKLRIAVTVVVTALMVVAAVKAVPPRYSWTSKLALFLLLWTAFIGASMATHDGRHLTVDALRKALPAKVLPYYQGVSHLVAAAFTAGFAFLAYLYLMDRLAENAAPNEIPDWIKVLAIPLALSLVTLRFLGQSIAAFAAGVLGLEVAPPDEVQP